MENTKIWDKHLNATMFWILEKSKTSNCKRLEKLIVTYLHMYKWNCYASRSIPLSEKKKWKLWGIYSTSYTYFPVPYLFVFSRNLLNLSNRCLRHRLLPFALLSSPSFLGWFSSRLSHWFFVWSPCRLCLSSSFLWSPASWCRRHTWRL